MKRVAKELGIDHTMVRRWVKHFEAGRNKRIGGETRESKRIRQRKTENTSEDPETKIKRLEAEERNVKKALRDVKGGMEVIPTTKSLK